MDIKDLSGPGIGFRASAGVKNLKKDLNLATRYGELKNLRDNIPAIVKEAKKYERDIRH